MTTPRLVCSVTPVDPGASSSELLVLGPSLGTTTALWDAVVPLLRGRYRILRFDLPGHGFSPAAREPFTVDELADAVLALVDSVGGGSFHYAGISLGGAVGIALGLRSPRRVASLAVICSAPRIGEPSAWEARAAQVRASGTASVVAGSAERWFAPGYLERDSGHGAAALTELLGIDDESYALCCEALAGFDERARTAALAMPTVFVAGELDAPVPAAELAHMAADAGARFEVIPGVAHLPSIEAPAAVARLLEQHLGGVHSRGMAVRRQVLGDAHVDRAIAGTTPETAAFQDFITRFAWGDIWSRPGLDRRSRSLLTIAALVTGSHESELSMHVRAALRNGLSREEISEAILHTAVYAGVPAANTAFVVMRETFASIDSEQD